MDQIECLFFCWWCMGIEIPLSVKDLFYMGGFIATMAAAWFRMDGRLKTNKTNIDKLSQFFKKVVLDENGNIRLQDKNSCSKHRVEIQSHFKSTHKEILDEQKAQSKEIRQMGENIMLIMFQLEIDTPKSMRGEVE